MRAFTLDFGGGADAAQAEARGATRWASSASWERVAVPESEYDLRDAIATIEDYHPLDVECAAAALCLLRGIRERYPSLRYLIDGDGGDENLKSYPLEDSDLTLSSVLRNPLLYQEGWGIDAIKHSLVVLGRPVARLRAHVRARRALRLHGVLAVHLPLGRSPRRMAMPFEQVLAGRRRRADDAEAGRRARRACGR